MTLPVQIAFHGIDHSDAIEQRVLEYAEKLERMCERATACRVVIEKQHRTKADARAKGSPFHVRVDLTIPGAELVAKRDPKNSHVNENIQIAIKGAFAAVERQLKARRTKRRRPTRLEDQGEQE